MSTMQSPQEEIAAIQATLALHSEDLERIKQWLPESPDSLRQAIEQQTAEFAAAHERIQRELNAVRERQDAQAGEIVDIRGEIVDIRGEIADIRGEIADIKGEIANIKDEIARIKETLNLLVDRTNTLVEQAAATSRTLTETNSRLGNLTGTRYERRVARNFRGILRDAIGLSRAQILHRDWGETDDNLIDLLDDAHENGAITRRQRHDVLDTDIIVAGQNTAGQRAYAVIEIGVTVSSHDVNRAARRARTLAAATDAECSAVVVGSEISDAEHERAERVSVAAIYVAAPED